jgi:hypothetical protein
MLNVSTLSRVEIEQFLSNPNLQVSQKNAPCYKLLWIYVLPMVQVALYLVILQVLGPSHPKTKRAQDTLKEPTYVRIATMREQTAAGTA